MENQSETLYTEFNVHSLSRELIGDIKPIGSANVDRQRLYNLKAHIALIEDLIFDLKNAEREDLNFLASVKKSNDLIQAAMKDLENILKGDY